ncbi:hypothetical protein SAMN05216525_12179 [Bradyrhizobium sp. Gha]|nr:hypothetical protein SAMN05216525_12179 [Bradyrhizobium sp. Gha]
MSRHSERLEEPKPGSSRFRVRCYESPRNDNYFGNGLLKNFDPLTP